MAINLDNSPELQSQRTRFMPRMVAFTEQTGLLAILGYYTPYHSKFNHIECYRNILEMHWNSALLETCCDTIGDSVVLVT